MGELVLVELLDRLGVLVVVAAAVGDADTDCVSDDEAEGEAELEVVWDACGDLEAVRVEGGE